MDKVKISLKNAEKLKEVLEEINLKVKELTAAFNKLEDIELEVTDSEQD